MFENIDKNTIQIANNCIKEVYEKFQDYNITSHLKKEEILERDFNNLFIFEDFFSEYLIENRDNNAREELIEDIVDLLDIHEGDITIEELYEALFSDDKKDLIEKKNKKELPKVNDFGLLDVKFSSGANVEFGDNHSIPIEELSENIDKAYKKIKNLEKADMVKESFKLKIKNPRINNSIETKNIGSEIDNGAYTKTKKRRTRKGNKK